MSPKGPARVPVRAVAAITVTAAALAGVLAFAVPTDAAWRDTEWTRSAIGALDCETPTAHATHAGGRVLSGSVLSHDTDAVAELHGVTVAHDGTSSSPSPAGATDLGGDAYANPLDVSALGTITLSLGSLLTLPLDTDVGTVNHYARARADGTAAGAAGAIANSGGIDLSRIPPGPEMPTSAILELGQLLDAATGSGLGGGVANLADVRVEIGAVASSATLDACAARWQADPYEALDRDYHIAGLRTQLDSALVGDLVTTADSALDEIELAIGELENDPALSASLSSAVGGAVEAVAGTLRLGTPSTTVNVNVDLAAARTLLDGPLADEGGVVEIDLDAGTVTVDSAALFDAVDGLNRQAPNTQVLMDAAAMSALVDAVSQAVDDWTDDLIEAVDAALDAAHVTIQSTIPLRSASLVELGTLSVGVDASIAGLLAGTAPLTASYQQQGTVCTLLPVACGLVGSLVTTITTTLGATLAPTLGGIVDGALDGVLATSSAALPHALVPIVGSLVTMIEGAVSIIFTEGGVLSVAVNVQNAPDPAQDAGHPEPGWAPSLPAPSSGPYSTGQYDVSAIRIVGIGALAGGVEIDLARASVGPSGQA